MTDVLVIKIPKELKKALCNAKKENAFNYIHVYCDTIYDAIKYGTPLPKGHGKIGDLDAVMSDIFTSIEEMSNIGIAVDGEYLWAKLNDAIYNAPTIIEADNAESEDKE